MTVGVGVMLVGLFLVPIALLWGGHRLRRRSARARSIFWGALIGYVISACVAVIAAMIPPATWGDGDVTRGFLGFWSLVVFPAVGAALGALRTARD